MYAFGWINFKNPKSSFVLKKKKKKGFQVLFFHFYFCLVIAWKQRKCIWE